MKRLYCEMCGSNDLIKQDGVFVCQNCLTKYTVEEARKIMLDGDTKIIIDTSKKEQSLFDLVDAQMKAENYADAYDTASRLIELNSDIWQGWAFKGLSLSYISKKDDFQFNESVVCFKKAYSLLSTQNQKEATDAITNYEFESILCLFKRYCTKFVERINRKTADSVSNAYDVFVKEIRDMQNRYLTSASKTFKLENRLAELYVSYLKAANKLSDKMFDVSKKTENYYQTWSNEKLIIMTRVVDLLKCDIPLNVVDELYEFLESIISKQLKTQYLGYSMLFKDYTAIKHISKDNKKLLEDLYVKMRLSKKDIVEKAKQRESVFLPE